MMAIKMLMKKSMSRSTKFKFLYFFIVEINFLFGGNFRVMRYVIKKNEERRESVCGNVF